MINPSTPLSTTLTSEINFGNLVSREIRNFKNRKTSSRLAESAWRATATSAARPVEFGRTRASKRPKSAVTFGRIRRNSVFSCESVRKYKLIYIKRLNIKVFSSSIASCEPSPGESDNFKYIINIINRAFIFLS